MLRQRGPSVRNAAGTIPCTEPADAANAILAASNPPGQGLNTACQNVPGCDNCTRCTSCRDCTDCVNCSGCEGCTGCNDCHNCQDCHNAHGLKNARGVRLDPLTALEQQAALATPPTLEDFAGACRAISEAADRIISIEDEASGFSEALERVRTLLARHARSQ